MMAVTGVAKHEKREFQNGATDYGLIWMGVGRTGGKDREETASYGLG